MPQRAAHLGCLLRLSMWCVERMMASHSGSYSKRAGPRAGSVTTCRRSTRGGTSARGTRPPLAMSAPHASERCRERSGRQSPLRCGWRGELLWVSPMRGGPLPSPGRWPRRIPPTAPRGAHLQKVAAGEALVQRQEARRVAARVVHLRDARTHRARRRLLSSSGTHLSAINAAGVRERRATARTSCLDSPDARPPLEALAGGREEALPRRHSCSALTTAGNLVCRCALNQ